MPASTVAPGTDANVERMAQFTRIQKLTAAVDALVARGYAAAEKDRMLSELEAFLGELEQLMDGVESGAAKVRDSCAVLRPNDSGGGAVPGVSAEVAALKAGYGEAMMEQLLRHYDRLVNLQERLGVAA